MYPKNKTDIIILIFASLVHLSNHVNSNTALWNSKTAVLVTQFLFISDYEF